MRGLWVRHDYFLTRYSIWRSRQWVGSALWWGLDLLLSAARWRVSGRRGELADCFSRNDDGVSPWAVFSFQARRFLLIDSYLDRAESTPGPLAFSGAHIQQSPSFTSSKTLQRIWILSLVAVVIIIIILGHDLMILAVLH